VPSYLEALLNASPLTSGLTLAVLTIGWPIAATLSGRVYLRVGFRTTVLLGSSIVILGTVELAVTSLHPALVAVGLGCFIVGLGLGLVAAPSLIAAQSSVAWGERAVVTGTNMFARSVGSAVGVAALGAVVNGMLRGQDATGDPQRFGVAVTWVFVGLAAIAVMLVVAGAAMPHHTTAAARDIGTDDDTADQAPSAETDTVPSPADDRDPRLLAQQPE
jgi:MFS family permease